MRKKQLNPTQIADELKNITLKAANQLAAWRADPRQHEWRKLNPFQATQQSLLELLNRSAILPPVNSLKPAAFSIISRFTKAAATEIVKNDGNQLKKTNKEITNKKLLAATIFMVDMLLSSYQNYDALQRKKKLRKERRLLAKLEAQKAKEESDMQEDSAPKPAPQPQPPPPKKDPFPYETSPALISDYQIMMLLIALNLKLGDNHQQIQEAMDNIKKEYAAKDKPTAEEQTQYQNAVTAYETLMALKPERLAKAAEISPEDSLAFTQNLKLTPGREYTLQEMQQKLLQFGVEKGLDTSPGTQTLLQQMQVTFHKLENTANGNQNQLINLSQVSPAPQNSNNTQSPNAIPTLSRK